jgi:hypothetical protein
MAQRPFHLPEGNSLLDHGFVKFREERFEWVGCHVLALRDRFAARRIEDAP